MHVGIMGAGSVGCYIGGKLAAAGVETVLVGRPALAEEIGRTGLRLTDCDGGDERLAAGAVRVVTSPHALAGSDVVLVTVKSQDTATAAAQLASYLGDGAVVASFQNGVRNPAVLRQALPGRRVLAAMVPYNVLRKPDATFHRGTSGALIVERTPDGVERPLVKALSDGHLATKRRRDVDRVQWGKLIFNLNNPLNALVGVPLREQLTQRPLRRILAAVMAEALGVVSRARIRPVSSLGVPPAVVPFVLRLPDMLFFRLASTMLRIDPEARSSMWDDLERRRTTEIDHLTGEIVRLAAEVGAAAPLNARIAELMRQAEAARAGSPRLTAERLTRELGLR